MHQYLLQANINLFSFLFSFVKFTIHSITLYITCLTPHIHITYVNVESSFPLQTIHTLHTSFHFSADIRIRKGKKSKLFIQLETSINLTKIEKQVLLYVTNQPYIHPQKIRTIFCFLKVQIWGKIHQIFQNNLNGTNISSII